MNVMKMRYILGEPIDTEIGKCNFIKVKDYPKYITDLQIISLSKDNLYYKYSQLNKNGKLDDFLKELKGLTLYETVVSIKDLSEAYFRVFLKVFDSEEIISEITPENFDFYRNLIMGMNCVKEERINPNPEIQKAIERSKRVKSQDGENLEFADMATSIIAFSSKGYKDLADMTVYQFYMTFYRIAQIKSYDTSTLFATVAGDKVNIENWSKTIDLYEEDSHAISEKEVSEKSKGIFN